MPSDDAQNPTPAFQSAFPAGASTPPPGLGADGPSPKLPPDPGSRKINLFLWPLILVLFVLTIAEQQSSNIGNRVQPGQPATQPQAPPPDPTELLETETEATFGVIARMIVKVGHALKVADPSAPVGNFVQALDQQRLTPLDQFRTIIAAGELQDDAAALKRLDDFDNLPRPLPASPADIPTPGAPAIAPADAEPQGVPPTLDADAATLRMIYSGRKTDLTPEQRDLLIKHHGKLGEIALTFKDPDTGPRAKLMAGGERLLFLLVFAGLGGIFVLIAGFVLCPLAIIMFATGRWRTRFIPPAPGGSVFLETFAVFLLAFLCLKLATDLLISAYPLGPNRHWPMYVSLAAQWLLVPAIFWPRLRGMSASAWSSAAGLHAGRGVAREIFAGIVGYLAGIPLLLLAIGVTAVLVILRQALNQDAPPPNNPIKDFLEQADMTEQLLLALAAVAWAPLVEETIFRGGIYRHLRSRLHWIVAAVFSALIFGLMHGYDPILLLPVITLGFNFALMREWRGSIISCMTAHALHNGAIMLIALVALNALK